MEIIWRESGLSLDKSAKKYYSLWSNLDIIDSGNETFPNGTGLPVWFPEAAAGAIQNLLNFSRTRTYFVWTWSVKDGIIGKRLAQGHEKND